MKYRGLEIDPRKLDETLTVKPRIMAESATAFKEAKTQNGTRYLLPRIEAIHAGATRNNTRYPAEKLRGSEELKSGVYSWLHPFPKPVIHNHDVETEATGRIQTAAFSEFTTAGRPGIIVVPKITQEKAIDDILGGRLLTVSIGATTDAAICSVCGTNIIDEGFCGHYKGEVFDGVTAEWIVGNVWFDELSWVNVPADQDAMIIDGGQPISTAEAFAANGREVINLGKSTTEWLVDPKIAIAEGLTITTQEEEGDSTLLTPEEIQALQDELATAKQEKENLETELAAKEAELTTAKEELATKEEELTAKETEVAELTTSKESLEAEKVELERTIAEEKAAREQAVAESAKLSTDMHKMVAERVVDLRVSLGKESNREEAIADYVARSTESLNDSLKDLLKESAKAPKAGATRTVEQLDNPASNNADPEPNQTNESLTAEDVLKNLFGGPAFKK